MRTSEKPVRSGGTQKSTQQKADEVSSEVSTYWKVSTGNLVCALRSKLRIAQFVKSLRKQACNPHHHWYLLVMIRKIIAQFADLMPRNARVSAFNCAIICIGMYRLCRGETNLNEKT
ncbi:hypothetical protein ACP50N_002283 [Klebsiella michiganensis]